MATTFKANRVKHKRLSQLIIAVLLLPTLYFSLQLAYLWLHAGRSQDRVGVFVAMLKLRASSEKLVKVRGRSDILVGKTGPGEKQRIYQYMQSLSWNFVDQSGSISHYQNEKQRRDVYHLSMTWDFQVYTLKPPRS